MSWKPIVVGVDASLEAAQAAAFASGAAARAGTSCHLIHATHAASGWAETPDFQRYRQAVIEQARTQLVRALAGLVPADVLGTLTVRAGATPVVVKQFAEALDAEFVVLGGKHHSALDRWFGGSTALSVARTSAIPLLVTMGAPAAIRRILVAVDQSAAARATLTAAERYAALFGAELRALSVLEPLPVIPDVPTPDMTEYYALCEEQLRSEIWSSIRTPGVEKLVRYGLAVETILREATEWQADLLVVGSHGKGWTERLLVGSVTERLLNQLPTSLLVIPATAQAVEVREAEARDATPALAIA
jgi:nucleotide-binding universal stress UspA family protein